MAFSRNGLNLVGPSGNNPRMWRYSSSDDAIAAINTSGYFNPAATELSVNDRIWVVDSANVHTDVYVNSNSGGVVDVTDGLTLTATDTD